MMRRRHTPNVFLPFSAHKALKRQVGKKKQNKKVGQEEREHTSQLMSTAKSAPTLPPLVEGMPSKPAAQETSAGPFDWRASLKKTPRYLASCEP
jgi:hypothetical protein